MAALLTGLVFKHYDGSGGEFTLALAIADGCHDDGTHVFFSVAELMQKSRQAERAVQLQLRKMQEKNWLILVREASRPLRLPREYRINPAWIEQASMASPAKPARHRSAAGTTGLPCGQAVYKPVNNEKSQGAPDAPGNGPPGAPDAPGPGALRAPKAFKAYVCLSVTRAHAREDNTRILQHAEIVDVLGSDAEIPLHRLLRDSDMAKISKWAQSKLTPKLLFDAIDLALQSIEKKVLSTGYLDAILMRMLDERDTPAIVSPAKPSSAAKLEATRAWAEVLAAIKNDSKPMQWTDARTGAALNLLGGYGALTGMLTSDVPFRQREFVSFFLTIPPMERSA